MDSCELCGIYERREIFTKLRFEDDRVVIVDCIMCGVPMAVAKTHQMPVPHDLEAWMEEKLRGVADAILGQEQYYVDRYERLIPDHRHFHARRTGW